MHVPCNHAAIEKWCLFFILIGIYCKWTATMICLGTGVKMSSVGKFLSVMSGLPWLKLA